MPVSSYPPTPSPPISYSRAHGPLTRGQNRRKAEGAGRKRARTQQAPGQAQQVHAQPTQAGSGLLFLFLFHALPSTALAPPTRRLPPVLANSTDVAPPPPPSPPFFALTDGPLPSPPLLALTNGPLPSHPLPPAESPSKKRGRPPTYHIPLLSCPLCFLSANALPTAGRKHDKSKADCVKRAC